MAYVLRPPINDMNQFSSSNRDVAPLKTSSKPGIPIFHNQSFEREENNAYEFAMNNMAATELSTMVSVLLDNIPPQSFPSPQRGIQSVLYTFVELIVLSFGLKASQGKQCRSTILSSALQKQRLMHSQ